jgi:hypothetical protein
MRTLAGHSHSSGWGISIQHSSLLLMLYVPTLCTERIYSMKFSAIIDLCQTKSPNLSSYLYDFTEGLPCFIPFSFFSPQRCFFVV